MIFLSDWDEMELSNKGYIISAILFPLVVITLVLLFVYDLHQIAGGLSFWAGLTLAPAFSQRFSNKYRKSYNLKVKSINKRHAEERRRYNDCQ